MNWISTPFLILAFATLVVFMASCAFCFLIGRVFGKMDGRDRPGEGRRTGPPDRRGPVRTGPQDRGRGVATARDAEPEHVHAVKQITTS